MSELPQLASVNTDQVSRPSRLEDDQGWYVMFGGIGGGLLSGVLTYTTYNLSPEFVPRRQETSEVKQQKVDLASAQQALQQHPSSEQAIVLGQRIKTDKQHISTTTAIARELPQASHRIDVAGGGGGAIAGALLVYGVTQAVLGRRERNARTAK